MSSPQAYIRMLASQGYISMSVNIKGMECQGYTSIFLDELDSMEIW